MKWIYYALATLILTSMTACTTPPAVEPAPPVTGSNETAYPLPEPANTPIPDPTQIPSHEPELPLSGFQLASSEMPRAEDPDVLPTELEVLAEGNSQFAFDLYHAIRDGDSNLFYSPYSISLALAMTYAGARGETADQMAETLKFPLPQERLHPAFNAIDQQLALRGQQPEFEDSFRLNIVNSLWGQGGYSFLPEYLDLLAEHYGAGMRLVDFAAAPEAARQVINDWVSEQTEERINDLLPSGSVDELTRLVLVNAIYFNARWAHTFEESLTRPGPFYLLDGGQVETPMMRQTETFLYARGDGYQIVELPYAGWELAMDIVVPDQGRFEEIETGLSAQFIQEAQASFSSTNMNLSMPKFEFDTQVALADTLKAMGMPLAFDEDADFSGIDGTRDLLIKDVIHKAFVAVDEEGTEAAAATGVVVGVTSMPAEPIEVKIDRPFIFLIRDLQTHTILFVGRVTHPAQ